ncbi:MAG: GH3 auxin-responsive promoter family protein [Myxococcota bacterium]|nr:GH3 auxin-responsive promoter family protein [Myxococcota bacterium]
MFALLSYLRYARSMHGLLARYAHWRYRRERALDWRISQAATLQRCLKQSTQTTFGLDHGLSAAMSVMDYQSKVPLRTFEALYEDYARGVHPNYQGVLTGNRLRFITTSSGTTSGLLKEFPVTWEGIQGSRKAAAHQAFASIAKLGHMRPFQRAYLSIADLAPLEDVGGGLKRGAITRILTETTPGFVKRRAVLPQTTSSDAYEVLDAMVDAALRADLGMLTGMTHWLLEFVERAKVKSGKSSMRAIWPNLQVICHGGMPAAVYEGALTEAFDGGDNPFVLAESYGASEGVLALGDPLLDGALRLCSQNGIFYEFVPVSSFGQPDAPRLGVHEIEAGIPYAIVVTTPSGLWSHVVGDVVEFLDAELKTLVVKGRLSGSIELWNEHMTESDVDLAFSALKEQRGFETRFYHVGAMQYPDAMPRGRYVFFVEPESDAGADASMLINLLDAELCRINKVYARLRAENGTLDEPALHLVPKGFFDAWLDARPGGSLQRKVPRVDGTGRVLNELLARLRA